MKLCFLLFIVAAVACWFRGCETHHHFCVHEIKSNPVRPIPAFKHSPEPRVKLFTEETL
jgi:hypothetical protein